MNRFLIAITAVFFLCFAGCGLFNAPIQPFIDENTALISLLSAEVAGSVPATDSSGRSVLLISSGQETQMSVSLDNATGIGLFYTLTGRIYGELKPEYFDITGQEPHGVMINIANPVKGERYDMSLDVRTSGIGHFHFELPPVICNTPLAVTVSPPQGGGMAAPAAVWTMPAPADHPGIEKLIITYLYWNGTAMISETEEYGWDEGLNDNSGGLTAAYGVDSASRDFSNQNGLCRINFPGQVIVPPAGFIEDYCFFKVTIYDRCGLSASDETNGFSGKLQIGNKTYLTFSAAIDAAAPGSAESPTVIELIGDISFPEPDLGTETYLIDKHIKLTVPPGETHTVTRKTADSGAFFTVSAGASLTLAGNGTGSLVLDGGGAAAQTTDEFRRPVVNVDGGELRMEAGTVIKDNYADMPAVYVTSGNFIMNGGEISGNKKVFAGNWRGGAVIVAIGASFTMNGGEIKDNTAYEGGGVRVESGSFTMNGGEIKNNTATAGGGGHKGQGGGVYVNGSGSTFTMTGGEISGNVVDETGSTNNPDAQGGGGVFVKGTGTFTMKGGSIWGNTIPANPAFNGKGALIADGTFNMEGDAVINAGNDVYLFNNHYNARITITGNLTRSGTVATITPDDYSEGAPVLSGSIISSNHGKFAVTPNGQNWTIDSAGTLQQSVP